MFQFLRFDIKHKASIGWEKFGLTYIIEPPYLVQTKGNFVQKKETRKKHEIVNLTFQ